MIGSRRRGIYVSRKIILPEVDIETIRISILLHMIGSIYMRSEA